MGDHTATSVGPRPPRDAPPPPGSGRGPRSGQRPRPRGHRGASTFITNAFTIPGDDERWVSCNRHIAGAGQGQAPGARHGPSALHRAQPDRCSPYMGRATPPVVTPPPSKHARRPRFATSHCRYGSFIHSSLHYILSSISTTDCAGGREVEPPRRTTKDAVPRGPAASGPSRVRTAAPSARRRIERGSAASPLERGTRTRGAARRSHALKQELQESNRAREERVSPPPARGRAAPAARRPPRPDRRITS